MEGVVTGGNRRIDKVLAEDYLAGLPDLPLADVRSLRDEAGQEETDLSYLRRLLQGRIDIVGAELARRRGTVDMRLVEELPRILAEQPRQPARGLGRYQSVEPSNAGATRRLEEQIASIDVSGVGEQDEDSLRGVLDELQETEARISERRRAVQGVFDAASAEITGRYREGRADVADLLRGEGG
ncbi:MAG TPA: aerial mycelium formation protein [Frankiaceae bacterium]|nr:aerial mycelium formation protein [Frankiaceae bacterium]